MSAFLFILSFTFLKYGDGVSYRQVRIDCINYKMPTPLQGSR